MWTPGVPPLCEGVKSALVSTWIIKHKNGKKAITGNIVSTVHASTRVQLRVDGEDVRAELSGAPSAVAVVSSRALYSCGHEQVRVP